MTDLPNVDSAEFLLRSVLNRSDWVTITDYVGADLLEGTPRMLRGAFMFESGGPSVYRRVLFRPGHSAQHVAKRPDAYVFEFSVSVVRESDGFDVESSPVSEETDVVGYAHSLVTYKVMPMDRKDPAVQQGFGTMRARIMTSARAVVIPPRAS